MLRSTISRPTISVSEILTPELRFEDGCLRLELRANRKLRVVELQGPKALISAYGATRPPDFTPRWFADDAEVPREAMDEVAIANHADFRWGCDIPMIKGGRTVISIPARVSSVQPIDLGIVSVVYEYTRFFGLLRHTFSSTFAVGSTENRSTNECAHAA